MEKDKIRNEFRRALVVVWGDVGRHIEFDVDNSLPVDGVLASLSYDSHVAVVRDRKLVRFASNHVLNTSPALLIKPEAIVFKYLLHEAIHVGLPDHDEDFELVADEVGTASTENAIEGGGFHVMLSVDGDMFTEVFVSKVRREALAFAKERRRGQGVYKLVY